MAPRIMRAFRRHWAGREFEIKDADPFDKRIPTGHALNAHPLRKFGEGRSIPEMPMKRAFYLGPPSGPSRQNRNESEAKSPHQNGIHHTFHHTVRRLFAATAGGGHDHTDRKTGLEGR